VIPIIQYSELETNLQFALLFLREFAFDPDIERAVKEIIDTVRTRGDKAVLEYTQRFDGVNPDSLDAVPQELLRELHSQVDEDFLSALREAIENVRDFHRLQYREDIATERPDGVKLSLRFTPIENVGLYVPGGAAAYPSSIVMNAVPAQIAGVDRIVTVTPPARFRENPHIAAAFVELSLTEIYTIGGAQAVAALA